MEDKNLKVAHLIGSLCIGGAERFIIDLSVTQRDNGLDTSIISFGNAADPLVSVGRNLCVPIKTIQGNYLTRLVTAFIALKKLNVIHVHSPHVMKLIQPLLPFLKAKVIYTRHGAAPYNDKKWTKFHHKLQPFIACATFVSQEGADNFQNSHNWPEQKIHVIDNGVTVDPVERKPSQKLRIGSVGRMVPLKSQIDLLKAVELVPFETQKNIEIHFYGDGPCLNQLRSYSNDNLSHLAIYFHGIVNDREAIYSSIDLLTVTSKTEGLSMVIIEAMANKIPVAATNVGGNPKLVKENKTGWLFEYHDTKPLSQIITSVVERPVQLMDFGKNAVNFIEKNFSLGKTAKSYLKIYQ